MGNQHSSIIDKVKLSFHKYDKFHKSRKSHEHVALNLTTTGNEQIKSDEEKQEKQLKYYLPNDNNDIDRQHPHHFIKRFVFQSNFSAPIEDKLIEGGCKVLDVACGAGTWLLDVACRLRSNNYFGLDLKPIFPKQIKPAHLTFVEADIFDGLPFSDNEFDFVRMETMFHILTPIQWNYAISEMIRVTKPRGYIELSESYTFYKGNGPIFLKLNKALYESSLQRGVDLHFTSQLDKVLELQDNIKNINQDERRIIVGPNGDKPGIIIQDLFISFISTDLTIESICPYLNMSKDECKELIVNGLINELKQTKAEYNIVRYWAQKI